MIKLYKIECTAKGKKKTLVSTKMDLFYII